MAAPAKYRYIVSAPGGPFAFLPHPHLPGLWLRTHPSVLIAPCEDCGARVGDLCVNRDGVAGTSTHWKRRKDAKGKLGEMLSAKTTIVCVTAQK